MEEFASPTSWYSVFGDFTFEPELIRFNGGEIPVPESSEGPASTTAKTGLAICDIKYGGGLISMEVESDHAEYIPAVQAVLFRDPSADNRLTAGFSSSEWDDNFTVNEFILKPLLGGKQGWNKLNGTGSKIRERGRSYRLEVEKHASIIEIQVDGIIVLRHRMPISLPPTQCGVFCQSKTEVRIRNFRVAAIRPKVFVVMEFSTPFNELYAEVIKPIVSECGLVAERADEVAGPGVIIADIERKLLESDIVIADITPQNENVFYELGYAHAIGKPTILTAEHGKKLPFDVSPFRTLFYDNTIAGKRQFEEGLRMHLNAILNPNR
ncbi:MAG: hypothetical protein H6815_13135 [Phycisphaeraceae bacterium]|nr:hypothetical protein [Phycisphaerales bacterium]MCB9861385.1 hypothetical protein [Phycisphaeraceae bacterium]